MKRRILAGLGLLSASLLMLWLLYWIVFDLWIASFGGEKAPSWYLRAAGLFSLAIPTGFAWYFAARTAFKRNPANQG